jgi:hypothetical protein
VITNRVHCIRHTLILLFYYSAFFDFSTKWTFGQTRFTRRRIPTGNTCVENYRFIFARVICFCCVIWRWRENWRINIAWSHKLWWWQKRINASWTNNRSRIGSSVQCLHCKIDNGRFDIIVFGGKYLSRKKNRIDFIYWDTVKKSSFDYWAEQIGSAFNLAF